MSETTLSGARAGQVRRPDSSSAEATSERARCSITIINNGERSIVTVLRFGDWCGTLLGDHETVLCEGQSGRLPLQILPDAKVHKRTDGLPETVDQV